MKKNLAALAHEAFGGKWRIPLALTVALLMLMFTEFTYQTQAVRLQKLSELDRARLLVKEAFQRVTDAESGKRGYLLVGGSDYLDPYRRASQDVRRALDQIHELDARSGDADLIAHQNKVDKLMADKLAEMQAVLAQHDEGRHTAALDMVRSGIGREIMEKLRHEVEQNLAYRNEMTARSLKGVQNTLLMGRIGVGALTVLSLILLVMFVREGLARTLERVNQQKALQDERDRLEVEVERRMSELKDLTRHLQTAREDERARLARDLHDELGALLTTAKLDVAVMRPQIQRTMPDLLPKLTHLTEALNSGIALKRRIIEDLCPSSLKTLGLVPSLEGLLYDTARVSGLQVTQVLQPVNLAHDEQLTFYRVVQESVTNTLKYAQATTLSVRMTEEGAQAVLVVEDNGQGMKEALPARGSHGLRGMRFRLEAAGGSLRIDSSPGKGVRLTARLPLKPMEVAAVVQAA